MHLIAQYQDGSSRTIRLTPSFFYDAQRSVAQKAKKLLDGTGYVYKAEINYGNKTEVVIENKHYKPKTRPETSLKDRALIRKEKIAEKKELKKMKKTLVNPSFTIVSKGGKTFDLNEIKAARRS